MYAQDSWRVRNNLTIDLGVRYSLYPPIKDTNNMLVTFDPKVYNAANAPIYANAAGTLLNYNTGDPLVGLVIAGRNSPYGRGIYPYDKKNASSLASASRSTRGTRATPSSAEPSASTTTSRWSGSSSRTPSRARRS